MTKVTFEEKYYPAVKETVYKTQLSNGLTVSLLPKQDFNEVYGIVTVQFGSVDATYTSLEKGLCPHPAGIAHFLEHKLFERENSEDIMAAFTRLGADSNAFTSFTKTSYLFSTIDHLLDNLDLLDELVGDAHFTEESVLREQDIIQQEREMYQDDPDSRLFFATLANLYPETSLATDIVGSEKSISEIQVGCSRRPGCQGHTGAQDRDPGPLRPQARERLPRGGKLSHTVHQEGGQRSEEHTSELQSPG